MNNLKKFATEADYTAATLNYPAVSWVTSGDTVHFDKTAPVVPNNKVKIAFSTDACGEGKSVLLNTSEAYDGLNSITVNGEPVEIASSDISVYLEANTDYLIEFELKPNVTNVGNWFAMNNMMIGCSSETIYYDILFPAQVTTIGSVGESVGNIIFEETTPPTAFSLASDFSYGIYVPDSAVNTYKTAEGWSSFSSNIHPISEYSGDIPV